MSSVFAFGNNACGQLGLAGNEHNAKNATTVDTPVEISALRGATVIASSCGHDHTLIATAELGLVAFGYNSNGELGLGDVEARSQPCSVEIFTEHTEHVPRGVHAELLVSSVACGAEHSLAATTCGMVFSWGSDYFGQLGLGLGPGQAVGQGQGQGNGQGQRQGQGQGPAGRLSERADAVPAPPPTAGFGASDQLLPRRVPLPEHTQSCCIRVTCGGFHSFALVQHTSEGENGHVGDVVGDPGTVLEVDSPRGLSRVLWHVWTWGRNAHGQLGLGDVENRREPHQLRHLPHPREQQQVRENKAQQWRHQSDSTAAHSSAPPLTVLLVAAGADHTIFAVPAADADPAARGGSDDVVLTCGRNFAGQLGLGHQQSCLVPTRVHVALHVRSITTGNPVLSRGVHLGSDGTISGSEGISGELPLQLRVRAAACGNQHTLLLIGARAPARLRKLAEDAAALLACGANECGQLGLGHTEPCFAFEHVRPQPSDGTLTGVEHAGCGDYGQFRSDAADAWHRAADVAAIGCGYSHSFVSTTGGALYAFGRNDRGQLGVGFSSSGALADPLADLSAAITGADAATATMPVKESLRHPRSHRSVVRPTRVLLTAAGAAGALGIGAAQMRWNWHVAVPSSRASHAIVIGTASEERRTEPYAGSHHDHETAVNMSHAAYQPMDLSDFDNDSDNTAPKSEGAAAMLNACRSTQDAVRSQCTPPAAAATPPARRSARMNHGATDLHAQAIPRSAAVPSSAPVRRMRKIPRDPHVADAQPQPQEQPLSAATTPRRRQPHAPVHEPVVERSPSRSTQSSATASARVHGDANADFDRSAKPWPPSPRRARNNAALRTMNSGDTVMHSADEECAPSSGEVFVLRQKLQRMKSEILAMSQHTAKVTAEAEARIRSAAAAEERVTKAVAASEARAASAEAQRDEAASRQASAEARARAAQSERDEAIAGARDATERATAAEAALDRLRDESTKAAQIARADCERLTTERDAAVSDAQRCGEAIDGARLRLSEAEAALASQRDALRAAERRAEALTEAVRAAGAAEARARTEAEASADALDTARREARSQLMMARKHLSDAQEQLTCAIAARKAAEGERDAVIEAAARRERAIVKRERDADAMGAAARRAEQLVRREREAAAAALARDEMTRKEQQALRARHRKPSVNSSSTAAHDAVEATRAAAAAAADASAAIAAERMCTAEQLRSAAADAAREREANRAASEAGQLAREAAQQAIELRLKQAEAAASDAKHQRAEMLEAARDEAKLLEARAAHAKQIAALEAEHERNTKAITSSALSDDAVSAPAAAASEAAAAVLNAEKARDALAQLEKHLDSERSAEVQSSKDGEGNNSAKAGGFTDGESEVQQLQAKLADLRRASTEAVAAAEAHDTAAAEAENAALLAARTAETEAARAKSDLQQRQEALARMDNSETQRQELQAMLERSWKVKAENADAETADDESTDAENVDAVPHPPPTPAPPDISSTSPFATPTQPPPTPTASDTGSGRVVSVQIMDRRPLFFELVRTHDNIGALLGRFTRNKVAENGAVGGMGAVEASGLVRQGDELVGVGTDDVGEMEFKQVCHKLREAVQHGTIPFALRFRVDVHESLKRRRRPSTLPPGSASKALGTQVTASPVKSSTEAAAAAVAAVAADVEGGSKELAAPRVMEPAQQRFLLQMLITGGLFKKHGRRGQPKDRWIWVSNDLQNVCWRKPTGERAARGTLHLPTLLAVLPGSHKGNDGGDTSADSEDTALVRPSRFASGSVVQQNSGLTLRFEARDVDLMVDLSETAAHNKQTRDEWMQAFRLLLAIQVKRANSRQAGRDNERLERVSRERGYDAPASTRAPVTSSEPADVSRIAPPAEVESENEPPKPSVEPLPPTLPGPARKSSMMGRRVPRKKTVQLQVADLEQLNRAPVDGQ